MSRAEFEPTIPVSAISLIPLLHHITVVKCVRACRLTILAGGLVADAKLQFPGLHVHLTSILSTLFCADIWKSMSTAVQSILGDDFILLLISFVLCPLACLPSELIWNCGSYRQSVGLLGWMCSPSRGRHLHRTAQTEETRTDPCLEWDSNPWSQCLRGHDIYIL
jgi:hypothetical protein